MVLNNDTISLVDTTSGTAIVPELLQEVHEVVGIVFPGSTTKYDVSAELGEGPARLHVTIKPQLAAGGLVPEGISYVYTAYHDTEGQTWSYTKEVEATCSCSKKIISTASATVFRERVVAHMTGTDMAGASSAAATTAAAAAAAAPQPAPPAAAAATPVPAPEQPSAAEGAPPATGDAAAPAAAAPAPSDPPKEGAEGEAPAPAAPESAAAPETGATVPPAADGTTASTPASAAGARYVVPPGCKDRCKAFTSFSPAMGFEDKMKGLVAYVGACIAGYADPELYDLSVLSSSQKTAYRELGKTLLADEGTFTITALTRPVRGPPQHATDAEQVLSKQPPWVRKVVGLPFTQWCLSQPWYLHYPASRDHPGVTGADMCLPARRAASRIRSEFPALDAYDSLAYDEQHEAEPPRVSEQLVTAKLNYLLKRTNDYRTPAQAAQRLGITLKQLADMVNLKEVGCLAIDMCCRCGVYVVDAKPAVACEHCVDVYHLECQGLQDVPEGEWVCPGCTIASGATGKAALAALKLSGKGGPGRTGSAALRGATVKAAARSAAKDAKAAAGKAGRKRALEGGEGTPVGDSDGGLSSDAMEEEYDVESEGDEDGAGGKKKSKKGKGKKGSSPAGDGGPRKKQAHPSLSNGGRPSPAEALLYATGVPQVPLPGADGRALVIRIATQLLNKHIAPGTRRWRPQFLVGINLLAGINTEYHLAIQDGTPPTILSEATLVHGGVRCNKCRPSLDQQAGGAAAGGAKSEAVKVDESENLLASPATAQEPPVAQLGAFRTCSQVFRSIAEFERHLVSTATPVPASHMWLPKHRMYLQGEGATRGLAELATAEAERNPTLQAALLRARQVAEEARKRAVEEGRDPDASGDDDDISLPPGAPAAVPAAPVPHKLSARQQQAHKAAMERQQRMQQLLSLPGDGKAEGKGGKGKRGREGSPSDAALTARQQQRIKALQQLKPSETRVLGQLVGGVKVEGVPGEGSLETAALGLLAMGGEVEGGAGNGTQQVMQLVPIPGTNTYTLVPKGTVKAEGTEGKAEGGEGGDAAAPAPAPAAPPAPSTATSAKMANLKLMRRFSALAGLCGPEGSAGSGVLKSLKACREAASQINDPQVQLESVGFIEDLVAQLEGLVQPAAAAAEGGGVAGGVAGPNAAKLGQLQSDVDELQSQLEEWAGLPVTKKAKMG